jgi:mannose/fructose/N-acetylgalactosamine-specific phosphotransferase system component IIC
MMLAALWRAAFWAGAISLDITGIGPFMVSQPLVCGPLFGWLMGQIRLGVIIGGIVQLVWMDVSPVGVGIPFDATAVTVLSVYLASLQPECPLPQIVLALLIAVPFGYFFSAMDSFARRLNTWAARRLESAADARLAVILDAGIVLGLIWSWARYVLFYAIAMALCQLIWIYLHQYVMPVWLESGLTTAAYFFPIAGLGVALEWFLTDEPERRLPGFRQKTRT